MLMQIITNTIINSIPFHILTGLWNIIPIVVKKLEKFFGFEDSVLCEP